MNAAGLGSAYDRRDDAAIVPAGDGPFGGLGRVVDRELNRRVHGLAYLLTEGRRPWLREVVPYASLLVYYDPDRIAYEALTAELRAPRAETEAEQLPPPAGGIPCATAAGTGRTGRWRNGSG